MDLERLKLKPITRPHDRVFVIIKQGTSTMEGINMEEIKERLRKNKLLKVGVKIIEEVSEGPTTLSDIAAILPPKKKAKKIQKKKLLLIDEGETEGEGAQKIIPSSRQTPKIKKGVAELGPEEWVEIGDLRRLPTRPPQINIKLSIYYINNRKIFINFMNSLFEPYKKELEDAESAISCESIGQGVEDFSLLTHQKIVRDYMNLYTPYRGLLLFHGLGSGKTCTSIAIAEGMKNGKRIVIMTPASLRRNYMEELKKCGDLLYKKNQYWEWISNTEAFESLSSILNSPIEYIQRKQGAWLVNVRKSSNYADLSGTEKKSLDSQLDEMIQAKYTFINYNGLRAARLQEMTFNYERNLFDNCVVIIDEAHNFISKVVNKLRKEKDIPENPRGVKTSLPKAMSLKLYEYLLSAQNAIWTPL